MLINNTILLVFIIFTPMSLNNPHTEIIDILIKKVTTTSFSTNHCNRTIIIIYCSLINYRRLPALRPYISTSLPIFYLFPDIDHYNFIILICQYIVWVLVFLQKSYFILPFLINVNNLTTLLSMWKIEIKKIRYDISKLLLLFFIK